MANNAVNANYGGKQPNTSTYVKTFNYGHYTNTWYYNSNYNGYNVTDNTLFLTPANAEATVYIPGNLIVRGTITNPSDRNLKKNIQDISTDISDKILNLRPVSYNYIDDDKEKLHYGFIAQDVEKEFPNLVNTISADINDVSLSMKTVNYLEMIPILLLKIKTLQSQIDVLNSKICDK
jgi:hypothetical protein